MKIIVEYSHFLHLFVVEYKHFFCFVDVYLIFFSDDSSMATAAAAPGKTPLSNGFMSKLLRAAQSPNNEEAAH